MKPRVEPTDIILPAWLTRIGEDRIERIRVGLSQIHNSLSETTNWGYTPFRRAFDAVAIELCEDPEFKRFYFQIRDFVVHLGEEMGWKRSEWLTQFDPNRVLPMIAWEASIIRTLSGERWRDAYAGDLGSKGPITSLQLAVFRAPPSMEMPKTVGSQPASSGTTEPETVPVKRRRGRPLKIANETKAEAAILKASGGTNREVAKIL